MLSSVVSKMFPLAIFFCPVACGFDISIFKVRGDPPVVFDVEPTTMISELIAADIEGEALGILEILGYAFVMITG